MTHSPKTNENQAQRNLLPTANNPVNVLLYYTGNDQSIIWPADGFLKTDLEKHAHR